MPNQPAEIVLMIPIVSIVMGIGVAFWAIYWDHRTKQLKYRERQLMIEKGITPPPMLPDRNPVTPEDCLRRGIIMFFLGIGLGIGYFILFRESWPFAWVCGVGSAIVGLLGIGYFVYYLIAKNRTPEGVENKSKIIAS